MCQQILFLQNLYIEHSRLQQWGLSIQAHACVLHTTGDPCVFIMIISFVVINNIIIVITLLLVMLLIPLSLLFVFTFVINIIIVIIISCHYDLLSLSFLIIMILLLIYKCYYDDPPSVVASSLRQNCCIPLVTLQKKSIGTSAFA